MKFYQMVIVIFVLRNYGVEALDNAYSNKIPSVSCGRRLVKHTPLIVDGHESQDGVWPWHASVFQTSSWNSNTDYKCGGTLVSSNAILTASHCVYENRKPLIPERIVIQLGRSNLKTFGLNSKEFKAYRVIFHPNFDISNLRNDIAIIKLATQVTFNDYIQPICLWSADKKDLSEVKGKLGAVVGFWVTNTHKSYTLQDAVMPVTSLGECLHSNRDVFGQFLPNSTFCASSRYDIYACHKDSGGSIVFKDGEVYRIRGIVSLKPDRSREHPNLCNVEDNVVFTDVAQYLPWIEEELPKDSNIYEIPSNSCGRRLVKHEPLIVGGSESHEGFWPWHATVFHSDRSGRGIFYKCGGTLLNSNAILTASHCVYENGQEIIPERITIQLGRNNLEVFGENSKEFRVYQVISHPNFKSSNLINDIAIIKLANQVTFNDYIQPICLWSADKKDLSEVEGKSGTVVGFGVTKTDQMSSTLQEAVMPIVELVECLTSNRNVFGQHLSNLTFCAGFRNGTIACNGDSGGSIVFEDEDTGVYRIRGIVSLTPARSGEKRGLCKVDEYVLFTDVAQYLPWIEEELPMLRSQSISSKAYDNSNEIASVSCGRRLVTHESKEGFWPWHAIIFHMGLDWDINYKCGGTLLNSNTILTAAHCVYESAQQIVPYRILIELGRTDLKNHGPNSKEFKAYQIISHPNFQIRELKNDIAILKLATQVTFDDFIQPICLWSADKKDLSEVEGKLGTVVGFGVTKINQIYYTLQEAVMPVVSMDTCVESNPDVFGPFLSNSAFCAGLQNDTSACNADIGGSIVFKDEDEDVYRIRGIVSLTPGRSGKHEELCKIDEYVLFTDVAQYLPWIEENVRVQPSPSISSES